MREQGLEQFLAGALAAPARDDGDRQLRRLLVDEAEARLGPREHPVPRCSVGVRPLERQDPGVACPAPVLHVAVHRPLRVLRKAPVVGVPQHVAKEADVVDPHGPKHSESVGRLARTDQRLQPG